MQKVVWGVGCSFGLGWCEDLERDGAGSSHHCQHGEKGQHCSDFAVEFL